MKRIKTECEKKIYEGNQLNRVLTLISQLLNAVICIAFSFILSFLIDSVQVRDDKFILKGTYIFIAYFATYLLFSFLNRRYKNRYMNRAIYQFKNYIFEKILERPVFELIENSSAKFISVFVNDLALIEANFIFGDIMLFSTVMLFLGASLAIMWNCWFMGIPILTVTLICLGLAIRYGKKLIVQETQTSEQNQEFVSQVKDLLNGYHVIKGFQTEKEVLHIFSNQNMHLEDTKCDKRRASDAIYICGDVSSLVVNTVIIGMGFLLTFKGIISIGRVMAMVQLGNFILSPIRTLPMLISSRNAALELINRIDEKIQYTEPILKGIELDKFQDNIVMQNVTFSYGKEQENLKDVSLLFEKGKSYAIVGESGSGKSTILKLLLGYFQNYKGTISIDGIDLKKLDLAKLYALISVIQQDVFMFNSSIYNNITMFKSFDEEEVRRTIDYAGLSEVVKNKGAEYLCGDGGTNLSGGEKQRVSIARCLLRKCPIVLVDEATASLDNETALQVERTILELENVMKIIVTHRYNKVLMKRYDELIVLNNGKVIERGNFDTLMKKRGYFYLLYSIANDD